MSASELSTELSRADTLQAQMLLGESTPLGATWSQEGVNFAVYSSGASSVELCLYDEKGNTEIARATLPGRTGDIWHGFLPVPTARPGLRYGYRAAGPYDPSRGQRYNPNKLLLDPHARAIQGGVQWREELHGTNADGSLNPADSAPFVPKGIVIDSTFDWDHDHSPAIPWRDTVIYELHVRGFTKLHPEVPPELRGTYLGLAQPAVLTYLKRLGVTALELMPVQAFVAEEFLVKRGLKNYWGYNSIAWFAPTDQYALNDPVVEFKSMVKAVHAAGLEVILDVVLNHTSEGNETGATLSLRGLDNIAYYKLEPDNLAHYQNRTGCGNTINVGDEATRELMIDCLKYWVEEMHVDGFRFDLAPVLGRDDGRFRIDAGFFKAVKAEPSLRYVKLIAEPWDIGPDGYQLSRFPAGWSEWNDLYRDTIRGFWRGNSGALGSFAERFAGSSDLFRNYGRRPTASINFITCHDGFTLNDLVSYNEKHNEANTENNQDGHNHNLSWNCGVEGMTTDETVIDLRERQMRNFLATLLLSQGVPMLAAGDEFARTQQGNNNAYCQDNEISWLDWQLAEQRESQVSFVSQLLFVRRHSPGLRRDTFLKGSLRPDAQRKDVAWLHPQGGELTPEQWNDQQARVLGVLIGHSFVDLHGAPNGHLLLLCNPSEHECDFRLPAAQTGVWHAIFDTACWRAPRMSSGPVQSGQYLLKAHSCVLLADGDAPVSIRSTFRSTQ
jgi:isoamylase